MFNTYEKKETTRRHRATGPLDGGQGRAAGSAAVPAAGAQPIAEYTMI